MATMNVHPRKRLARSGNAITSATLHRRGSAMTTTLIALSIAASLAATAWFASPAYLHAGSTSQHEAVVAQSERHQQIIELIANLIGSSAEVIAIYPRGVTPYAEVVLRLAGAGESVNGDEIALLSHSRLLQTVTLYTHSEGDHELTRSELLDRGFPDQWRGDPLVQPRLLAAGLSDMQVQVVQSPIVRIALTWAADSADGEDEALVYVNARIPQNED